MATTVERIAFSLEQAGIEWRHLDEKHPEDRAWLQRQEWLPSVAVDALLAEETRPRFAAFDKGDVIILRGVNLNPEGQPDDMVALRCWFSEERVITVSRRHVVSVDELRERVRSGQRFDGADDFLVVLGQALTAKIRGLVRDMEEEFERHEDMLLARPEADVREPLRHLRAQAIGMHRYVAPQHEALEEVVNTPPKWLVTIDTQRLREVADQTERAMETLASMREDVRALQDQISLHQTERMNRISYLLTIIAGLFLPLNLLAAMLGANVGGIPGAEAPNGFWWMSLVFGIVTVAGWLALRWLRHRV